MNLGDRQRYRLGLSNRQSICLLVKLANWVAIRYGIPWYFSLIIMVFHGTYYGTYYVYSPGETISTLGYLFMYTGTYYGTYYVTYYGTFH